MFLRQLSLPPYSERLWPVCGRGAGGGANTLPPAGGRVAFTFGNCRVDGVFFPGRIGMVPAREIPRR